jgi:nitrogenase molybdenum-iron cofactor biosynthesis protein NifN
MVELVDDHKALVVNPIMVSERVGAVLAFLGLAGSMPIEHGVRGCAGFTKLFFMRHFREPIPLQTTAVNQAATILGGEDNLVEALHVVSERHHPKVIGVVTTTMAEFQGADLARTVAIFRRAHPECAEVDIVPVACGDGQNGLEGGFARAVEAIIDAMVPDAVVESDCVDISGDRRVNVLASPMLTPADLGALKDWIAEFGLHAVLIPDLDDSLDGHLTDDGYSSLTYGGTTREQLAQSGRALATIVVGASLESAANLLKSKTGVPDFRFRGLMGLAACDELTWALQEISGCTVPDRLVRQRARLLDAMVDCQFYSPGASVGLSGDPDLVNAFATLLAGAGIRMAAVVSSVKAASLDDLPAERVIVGDLGDLELAAKKEGARFLIGNSHATAVANRLGIPLLRAGFPQYDVVGAGAKTWIGYEGSRQTLFEVTNLLLQTHRGPKPFVSIYRGAEVGPARDARKEGPPS